MTDLFFTEVRRAAETHAEVPIRNRRKVNQLANAMSETGWKVTKLGRRLRLTFIDEPALWFEFVPTEEQP